MPIAINTPLSEEIVSSLKIGDRVAISGKIIVARDAAHKRFGNHPPFEVKGQILFSASPTPTPKGKIIGSLGPTTASRMDPYSPALLAAGLKGMMGKGSRGKEVVEAIKKYKAIYFLVPGGIAASLSHHVKSTKVIAYPDLGPEAVLELEVEDLPAIVAIDSLGRNLFEEGRLRFQTK